ncbi:MAG: CRISPR system precrRNA processing endoribonuclease RAMP protein Cas6 [Chloroflexi bacterium]|nr:CRISPR system precrRNA processing endoribonuclease RAMP protein Cas6 [Chloroflexota bacterium]
MDNFTAHQLHFTCEVQTPILLNEHQGSAIRGALFHALRNQFCFNKKAKDCGECAVWATCPICFLVATRNPNSERGVDVPRPYIIEPPLDGKISYQPGETLEFGLTMFAQALNLFPYLVLGSKALEQGGLGKKLRREDGRWRRGTFAVREIGALNRLSGERQPVLRAGDAMVSVPDLPVTNEQVQALAAQLPRERITLVFKTPTRIIEQSKLQHRPTFRPLIQRLHQRLRDLTREFTDATWELDLRQVMAEAEAVQVAEDQTRWVELDSFSTRRRTSTPMGGLVGQVTFEGNLEPFLPWLVWGEIVHVGKDAVKGNGWYEISG